MVKGISKQVIVVNSPDKKLFDQAIFFLSDEAMDSGGITDAALLKEAKRLINSDSGVKKKGLIRQIGYAVAGGAFMGLVWMLFSIL